MKQHFCQVGLIVFGCDKQGALVFYRIGPKIPNSGKVEFNK
jgi:hypothetical protein